MSESFEEAFNEWNSRTDKLHTHTYSKPFSGGPYKKWIIELHEQSKTKAKKRSSKEHEELPEWLTRKPRSARQKLEMIEYCRQKGLEIPPHLNE